MPAYRTRHRFRFGDIDSAGIAYYPRLLHACHCAMEDWWKEGLGRNYPDLLGVDRYGMPAVHLDVEFLRPVRYGDEPWIRVGVLEVGKTSVKLLFEMVDDDGAVMLRARIKTVGVDMDTMRPVPVPAQWRERFADFAVDDPPR